MNFEMYVVCASVGVIAEMSNGILFRRDGGFGWSYLFALFLTILTVCSVDG
jgi:hypothetical protein